ncbi:hypothetical protein ACNPNP_05550 [Microbacterium sp. AGC85]
MNKKIRITMRRRAVVVREDEKGPFWLAHIVPIACVGIAVLIAGIVLLSFTDRGRATMMWIGLGLGIILTVYLLIVPARGIRQGAPVVSWAGGVLAAFGCGGIAISLLAGIPFVAWAGLGDDLDGGAFIPGVGSTVFTAVMGIGMWMLTRGPLPALDRTARSARVMFNTDDADGAQSITVQYCGADGEEHEAELADLIDDSWRDRFAPGTTWKIYAFQDPDLADAVVLLTEEHEEVWRDGYKLNGVRLGGESGAVKPGPGSPFLREGGKWSFEA